MTEGIPNINDLREGERYNRELLHQTYGGAKYRGIAPSADHSLVFLFTGESGKEHGYKDRFRGDTFIYTGEGREGDMDWSMGNKAIRDHRQNGDELHLFESTDEAWVVTYLGQYQCIDWFEEPLPDTNGNMRQAIRFKLEPVDNHAELDAPDLESASLDELYEAAAAASETAGESVVNRTQYTRSEIVKEYALRAANGVCQGCGNDAPFMSKDGDPYLEVHHLDRRSDGGPDHPDNVIALCPNCHRRVHYGADGEQFNQELMKS